MLAPFAQVEIVPNPPHTNMMHLFLHGDRAKLIAAALEVSRKTGVWLFKGLAPTILPAYHQFEFVVGDATLDLTNDEIVQLFQMLFSFTAE